MYSPQRLPSVPDRIMILEPDPSRRHAICSTLLQAGFRCISTPSVQDALPLYHQDVPLLTILNARLPWRETAALLKCAQEKDWPVLFITAEAANVSHLLTLFDLPCDALVAPFTPQTLLAAVEHLMLLSNALLRAGPLRLDVMNHRATLDGEHLTLTAQEFALLEALVKTPGLPVSRETLLKTAWGYQDLGETRTVDVHIQRLRRKLGKSSIETVYKTGYKLKMT